MQLVNLHGELVGIDFTAADEVRLTMAHGEKLSAFELHCSDWRTLPRRGDNINVSGWSCSNMQFGNILTVHRMTGDCKIKKE